jgi:NAD+ diphosphatase
MIHEILPHRFNNRFHIKTDIDKNDFVFLFHENKLLLKVESEKYILPKSIDIPFDIKMYERNYLFSLDDTACFLIWNCLTTDDENFVYKEITFFRTLQPKEIAWICIVSFQLMNWYVSNKFCGRCGSKTMEKPDERAIVCTGCHSVVYPKVAPAVIVAIVCDDKILLARNANFPNSWFSLIAGYVDTGESLEETVVREVKEEVGIDVTNVRYYKSQPWPFSGSLMIGFVAEADFTQTIQTDNKEITEAAWFTRGNLPNHPPNISIAGEIIEKFKLNQL